MAIHIKLTVDNKTLEKACEKWNEYFSSAVGQAEQYLMIYQIKQDFHDRLTDRLKHYPQPNDKDNN